MEPAANGVQHFQFPAAGRVGAAHAHGDAETLGKGGDRFGEGQAVVSHQKIDDASSCAAAEAVVNPLSGIDHKRWRFFRVEGAEALEVRSRRPQGHTFTDHLQDVGAILDFLDGLSGQTHGYILP